MQFLELVIFRLLSQDVRQILGSLKSKFKIIRAVTKSKKHEFSPKYTFLFGLNCLHRHLTKFWYLIVPKKSIPNRTKYITSNQRSLLYSTTHFNITPYNITCKPFFCRSIHHLSLYNDIHQMVYNCLSLLGVLKSFPKSLQRNNITFSITRNKITSQILTKTTLYICNPVIYFDTKTSIHHKMLNLLDHLKSPPSPPSK